VCARAADEDLVTNARGTNATPRQPVPLALIGAGAMAANHARVIAEGELARLHVVIDTDGERAQRLAERYGCAWSTDIEEAQGAAAAIVASSTESHPEVAGHLLSRELPLLVEKPLATDLAAAHLIVAESQRRSLPLMCGFVERFNPAVTTTRELLEGEPIHVTSQRHSPPDERATTSVVTDLLIHDIDLAMHLTGCSSVTGVSGNIWTPDGGVPEVGNALLTFAGGLVASLSASRRGQRKSRQLSVATSNHLVEIDLLRADVTVYRHVRHEAARGAGYRAETIIEIPFVRHRGEPLASQLDHFLALIEGRADPEVERATLLEPHAVAARVAASAGRYSPATGHANAVPAPRVAPSQYSMADGPAPSL
jgi:predicted dehydrogenase